MFLNVGFGSKGECAPYGGQLQAAVLSTSTADVRSTPASGHRLQSGNASRTHRQHDLAARARRLRVTVTAAIGGANAAECSQPTAPGAEPVSDTLHFRPV
jgi:hypothetical protein